VLIRGVNGHPVPWLAATLARIAAAIELIHRHPDNAWTVGELAAEVALSRSDAAVLAQ
jgi:AraC-like DNA-binding protein